MTTSTNEPTTTATAVAETALAAIHRPDATRAISVSPIPCAAEINALVAISNAVAKSRIIDKVRSAEQAFTIMLAGRELGVGPMQSLREIDIIEGKLSLSAQAALGRVHKLKLGIARIVESTTTKCVMFFQRFDDPANQLTVTWTIEQAAEAGLLVSNNNKPKKNWTNFPRAMLFNRTAMEGVRAVFPDAFSGVYCTDEITDDGEIIDAEFEDATPDRFKAPSNGDAPKADAPGASSVAEEDKSKASAPPVATAPAATADTVATETPVVPSPAATAAPSIPDRFNRVAAPSKAPAPVASAPIAAPESEPVADDAIHDVQSIQPHHVEAIQKLYSHLLTPKDEWQRHLGESYGVDTIRKLTAMQATALIRSMLMRCSTKDGSIRFGGLTDDEIAALGITFPIGADATDPKQRATQGVAAPSSTKQPTDSGDDSQVSTTNGTNS